jgi:hypothetical protein
MAEPTKGLFPQTLATDGVASTVTAYGSLSLEIPHGARGSLAVKAAIGRKSLNNGSLAWGAPTSKYFETVFARRFAQSL